MRAGRPGRPGSSTVAISGFDKAAVASVPPPIVEADFEKRVRPSLRYCQEVGNIYSGTIFLALCGVLAGLTAPARIGLFSYGSGCCSEFYSGTADAASAAAGQRRPERGDA